MPLPLPLPPAIHIGGPVVVSGFTFSALAAAALGFIVAARRLRAEPRQVRRGVLWALLWGALAGLVSARLADQWVAPDLRWAEPATWLPSLAAGRGLSWAGGLVEGTVVFAAVLRSRKFPWRRALDRVAPAVAWAAALGWIGLPFYGRLTSLPWGLIVAPGFRVQPVQIYGGLGFAGLGWLLAGQQQRLAYAGGNGVTLVALSSALRLLLGFVLPGARTLGPWTPAQAADVLLLGAALLWGRSLASSPAEDALH